MGDPLLTAFALSDLSASRVVPDPGHSAHLTREIFGNHSSLSINLFYATAALGMAIFVWGYWRRARLWRLGRPFKPAASWPDALKHVLFDVLLQRRVAGRGWASWGHGLLFAGFMGLLLATSLLSVEHVLAGAMGRTADDPVFHKGIYFAVYEFLADGFGIALLLGCLILGVRRWRRADNFDHHWTDWAVLGSLATLGVTGYLVEGLRIIHEQTPAPEYSFVGLWTAHALQAIGVREVNSSVLHFTTWWFHAVLALGFIAAFPFVRLMHALAGSHRLSHGTARLGRMHKIEVEELEETGIVGVGELRQFTRQQLMELDACMSCGRCEAACPAFEAGKPLSPRRVVQDLHAYMQLVGPPLLRAGNTAAADDVLAHSPSLHGEIIAPETNWSCTTCMACTHVCPVGVNPLGMITDMRRHLVAEGQLRGTPANSLQSMDRVGNPWGMPPQDRMAWAAGLNVPLVSDGQEFDVLYWVGCAAAYDRRIQKVARSVARLLSAAGVRFAILGNEERCTGESARRMGDEFLFQQLAAQNVETLARHGLDGGRKKIVSHCPHCVNSFRQDYPQCGGQYEVVHHTQFLAELAQEGRLPDVAANGNSLGTITYHDPCYLARAAGVTKPPRELLSRLTANDARARLAEMPRRGANTSCCGAGGGRMWFDDPVEKRAGTGRVEEALATGALTVAVSCPFCLTMMRDGIAARDPGVGVQDIAELMAAALPANDDTVK